MKNIIISWTSILLVRVTLFFLQFLVFSDHYKLWGREARGIVCLSKLHQNFETFLEEDMKTWSIYSETII